MTGIMVCMGEAHCVVHPLPEEEAHEQRSDATGVKTPLEASDVQQHDVPSSAEEQGEEDSCNEGIECWRIRPRPEVLKMEQHLDILKPSRGALYYII